MPLLLLLSWTLLAEPDLAAQKYLVLDWDGRELPLVSFADMAKTCTVVLSSASTSGIDAEQGGRFRWLLQRGRARQYLGEFTGALADFSECLQSRPDEPVALFECARVCLMSAKTRERGLKLSTRLEKEFSEPAKSAFLAGLYNIYMRSPEKAVIGFSQALSTDPNWLLARYYRGVSYYELGRMEESISDLEAVLLSPHATHATEWEIRSTLCEAFCRVGSYDRAYAEMVRTYELIPGQKPAVIDMLWKICAWRRRAGTCVSLALQGIKLSPNNPICYRYAAISYASLGDLDKAQDYVAMALKRAPFDADNWAVAASVRAARGEYQDARIAFSKAVTLQNGKVVIKEETLLRSVFFLATCPDEKVRDGKRAMQLIDLAWPLTHEKEYDRQLLTVLKGLATAELGDTTEGARLISDAIGQRPLEPDELRRLTQLKDLLQNGKPYRHLPKDPKQQMMQVPMFRGWGATRFSITHSEFRMRGD